MSQDIVSIIGEVAVSKPHRKAVISKVENGFRVEADFVFDVRKGYGVEIRYEEEWAPRTFVFYTIEEALGFLKEYMTCSIQNLKKQA